MYGLKIAEYVLPLISVPYLVRTLGLGGFGQLAYAQSLAQIFVVLTDYGMALTGTRLVSKVRDDQEGRLAVFASVTATRLLLLAIATIGFTGIVYLWRSHAAEASVMWASYLFVVGNCILPVWFLQGIEALAPLAGVMVGVRLIGVIAIFLLVHGPDDVVIAAIANSAVPVVAGGVLLGYLAFQGKIAFRSTTWGEVVELLRVGRDAFGSTIAVTTYNLATPIIVGNVAGQAAVGLYSAAEKIIKLATNGLSPVFQAMFPRMSYEMDRNEEEGLRLLRRVAIRVLFLALCASVFLAVGSPWIVEVLFGTQFQSAAIVLQIMSPLPLVITAGNLLGNQLLFNLGRQRQFGRTYYVAAGVFVVTVVFAVSALGARGGAVSVLIAELCVLMQFAFLVKREGISLMHLKRVSPRKP